MAQLMTLPLTVSRFNKIQIRFTFLVPVYPGSTGKRTVKRGCVCVCNIIWMLWRAMHSSHTRSCEALMQASVAEWLARLTAV